jgi:hypothetical protein
MGTVVTILYRETNVVVLQRQRAKKWLPWLPFGRKRLRGKGLTRGGMQMQWLPMATTVPTNPEGVWTSNGPHAEGVSGRIGCKCLKTVAGPWRLERQTSTVSR